MLTVALQDARSERHRPWEPVLSKLATDGGARAVSHRPASGAAWGVARPAAAPRATGRDIPDGAGTSSRPPSRPRTRLGQERSGRHIQHTPAYPHIPSTSSGRTGAVTSQRASCPGSCRRGYGMASHSFPGGTGSALRALPPHRRNSASPLERIIIIDVLRFLPLAPVQGAAPGEPSVEARRLARRAAWHRESRPIAAPRPPPRPSSRGGRQSLSPMPEGPPSGDRATARSTPPPGPTATARACGLLW
jgi:hypothetical protein